MEQLSQAIHAAICNFGKDTKTTVTNGDAVESLLVTTAALLDNGECLTVNYLQENEAQIFADVCQVLMRGRVRVSVSAHLIMLAKILYTMRTMPADELGIGSASLN